MSEEGGQKFQTGDVGGMSPCPEPMSPSLKNNESKDQSAWTFHVSSPGGGGTLLYNPYRYVLPHRVGFLRCLDLKTGIHFAHFGLVLVGVTRPVLQILT